MTCGHCHERIDGDEAYDTFTPDSPTGTAPTVYLHKRPCKRVPRQTAPTPSTSIHGRYRRYR